MLIARTIKKRKIQDLSSTGREAQVREINDEKLERCRDWISQQKKEKPKVQTIVDDLDADELPEIRLNSATGSSDLVHRNQNKSLKIYFACEWQRCNSLVESYADLQLHLTQHVDALQAEDFVYKCAWDLCKYESTTFVSFKRHVLFHVYITNLKTLGEQLLLRRDPLPPCVNDSRQRNMIGDTESAYVCMWRDCNFRFDYIQEYFDHASSHCVHEIEMHKVGKKNPSVQCQWLNCKKTFHLRLKMTEHMRTHTGERCIACSNCGSTFNSNAKFFDHYRRQAISTSYKCDQCFRSFPTEELLSNHMYGHINCLKCTMCDMTCPSPSALTQHFRYRHIKERPYKCQQCNYGAVTRWDLNKHIIGRHKDEETTYYCEECDFSCLTLSILRKHENNVHQDGPKIYVCHCCDKRYQNGNTLSKHLIKNHGFQLPSGHRRFTYRQDIDGMYRVQTTRMESLEVSEQIMSTPVHDNSKAEHINYELTNFTKTATGVAIEVTQKTIPEPPDLDMLCDLPDTFELDEAGDLIDECGYADVEEIMSEEEKFTKGAIIAPFNANDPSSDIKNIDDFSVMKKYLKKKKQNNTIFITLNDVDKDGNVVHSETQEANEYEFE